MEKVSESQQENPLISYDQSFALATRLFKEYHDKLTLADLENFGHANTGDFINKIPTDLREKFIGHGITRGGKYHTEADLLAAFINILDNSTIKGDCGSLISGQLGAFARADLLILSHYNTHLISKNSLDNTESQGKYMVHNEIGWIANIGAYVVSNKYYPILDELKKLYPDKNIIRTDEIVKYVEKETGEKLTPEK